MRALIESCTPGAAERVRPHPSHLFLSADWMGGGGVPGSPCHLGVPHHHVSVRVLGDAAFLRVEVEDFRRVAAGDGHKSILVHFAAVLEGVGVGGRGEVEGGKQSSGFELKGARKQSTTK